MPTKGFDLVNLVTFNNNNNNNNKLGQFENGFPSFSITTRLGVHYRFQESLVNSVDKRFLNFGIFLTLCMFFFDIFESV